MCWMTTHEKFVLFIFKQIHWNLIMKYDSLRVLFVEPETFSTLVYLESSDQEGVTFKSLISRKIEIIN